MAGGGPYTVLPTRRKRLKQSSRNAFLIRELLNPCPLRFDWRLQVMASEFSAHESFLDNVKNIWVGFYFSSLTQMFIF